MNKFIALVLMSGIMVGCASKSDLAALSSRVDALETNQKNIAAEHQSIKADHEAIKGDIADLTAKFDKAFVKKNLK